MFKRSNYFSKNTCRSNAFTLIEMSIVLVIIGLIVASVVVGQKMIEQAKLNRIASDLKKYETAVLAFQVQYNGIPGDLSNAYSFWGSDCASDDSGNCNGDGNGNVDIDAGVGREDMAFWHHLGLAKFTGSFEYLSATVALGRNMPESPFTNVGYWGYLGLSGKDLCLVTGSKRNSAEYVNGEALTPSQARSIDKKYDDDAPGTGKIHARRDQDNYATTTICIDTQFDKATIADAAYILTDTTTSCVLYYVVK